MNTYEQKYKEAIERCKSWMKGEHPECFTEAQKAGEFIFPELKESEDEKIRKGLIKGLSAMRDIHKHQTFSDDAINIDDAISWLEKQGEQEQLYIRFGEIPTDEKSKIFQGEIEVGTENGVSVYPAFKTSEGDIILGLNLPITKTTLYTQQHLIEYDDRPCYLVRGDYVGKDTDGQPLISNVSIIEKINTYRVKEKKQGEQKSEELPNGEGYGIDSLYHAVRILEKTLGEVEGYQSDDGILEHECAISAVKKLYEQKPAWSEEDEKMLNKIIDELTPYGECPDYPSPEEQEYYYTRQEMIDWLNKKMFDYRGLIPMGLGIDCTGLNIY